MIEHTITSIYYLLTGRTAAHRHQLQHTEASRSHDSAAAGECHVAAASQSGSSTDTNHTEQQY